MNLIFAGTPEFAVPALKALIEAGHRVLAVYTRPDRPAGRGRKLAQSPVKEFALAHGIEVRQPTTLKRDTEAAALRALEPDAMIVIAYGLLLPESILEIPTHGCINVHASLGATTRPSRREPGVRGLLLLQLHRHCRSLSERPRQGGRAGCGLPPRKRDPGDLLRTERRAHRLHPWPSPVRPPLLQRFR